MVFTSQLSYLGGTQTASKAYAGQKWDFQTIDAFIEYNFTFKNLLIRPGINYRQAVYDDRNYSNVASKQGWINSEQEITTTAASLRADYKLLDEKLRLVAGLRLDKFNVPDKSYLSYQLIASYKVGEKHIFRIVHSKANSSPFLIYNYIDQVPVSYPIGYKKFMEIHIGGNEDLKLLTNKMIEFGYRGQLAQNLQIDLEIFGSQTTNYTNALENGPRFTVQNTDTIIQRPLIMTDLPIKVRQTGVTISLNYVMKKFQIKPFVTYQQSKIYNYSPYYFTSQALPSFNPTLGNLVIQQQTIIFQEWAPLLMTKVVHRYMEAYLSIIRSALN